MSTSHIGKADLHIHTSYSYDGTATVKVMLQYIAQHTDLDVIAITDHDEIDGALEALELAPYYGLEVIPGIEISTAEGHVLALFVRKLVPPNLSLVETVHRVAEQGGICIAAHPGGRWSWCLSETAIQRALRHPGVAQTLLGLETYNASLPDLRMNDQAAAMNKRLALATVGNSDAHMPWMVGLGVTCFPGNHAIHLRTALQQRLTTTAIMPRPHYYMASYLKGQILRYCGLVHCTTTPGGRAVLRRLSVTKNWPRNQPVAQNSR
ncbi:MAG: PHP domain-containing protein [Chloroflexi bacterium]|nr:PHP domain-containing protein [Chloroflexota bacterium]